jgi:hypothetical protein
MSVFSQPPPPPPSTATIHRAPGPNTIGAATSPASHADANTTPVTVAEVTPAASSDSTMSSPSISSQGGSGSSIVKVTLLDGPSCTVPVTPVSKILALKHSVAAELGIRVEEQEWTTEGHDGVLRDSMSTGNVT